MQLHPRDFQLVPKWTYAELQQPGVWQQNLNRKKPRIQNCPVSLVPHKRTVHSPLNSVVSLLFSLCVKCKVHTAWGVGKEKRWAKPDWATASLLLSTSHNETLCPFPLASLWYFWFSGSISKSSTFRLKIFIKAGISQYLFCSIPLISAIAVSCRIHKSHCPPPPPLGGVQQKLDMCFAESNLIKLFRGFTRLHLAIYSYLLLPRLSLHWKSGIFSSPLLTFPQEASLTCTNSTCQVVLITKNIRSIPSNFWGIYVQLANPAWSQLTF